jgi:FkbM family methyltransferase
MKHLGRIVNHWLSYLGIRIARNASLKYKIERGDYKWLQERNILTVLDIGANIGQFAQLIHEILPQARILSFEPLPDQFKQLERLTEKIPLLRCYPFAAGSENSEKEINANEFSASSSLLPMTELHTSSFPFTLHSVAQKAHVRTLDSVLPETALQKNVLLKIDVQGYEMEVLKGAERVLGHVDVIIIETSFQELYRGQPLFDEIYQCLVRKNFTFHGSMEPVFSTINGEVLQFDAIFIRS